MDLETVDSLGFVALQESFKDFFTADGSVKPVPFRKVEEVSLTQMYVGTSYAGGDSTKAYWRITKVVKSGGVTNIFYPTTDINIAGDTGFKYTWDARATLFPVLPP
jgi:hypothetical protein